MFQHTSDPFHDSLAHAFNQLSLVIGSSALYILAGYLEPGSIPETALYTPLRCLSGQLSASGDGGEPEVVSDPTGDVAKTFSEIGVCVVQQCAKLRKQGKRSFHCKEQSMLG